MRVKAYGENDNNENKNGLTAGKIEKKIKQKLNAQMKRKSIKDKLYAHLNVRKI